MLKGKNGLGQLADSATAERRTVRGVAALLYQYAGTRQNQPHPPRPSHAAQPGFGLQVRIPVAAQSRR